MNTTDYLNLGFAICISLLSWGFTIKYYINTEFGEKFLTRINPKTLKWISLISKSLLYLLIIDEIGLLLNEWGAKFIFFDFTRNLISIPGIAHLVFLANLLVATFAAKKISSGYLLEYTDDEEKIEIGSSLRAIVVLGLSLLMMATQLLVYDTYGTNLSTSQMVVYYFGFFVLFVVPPIMMVIKSTFMRKEDIDFSKKKSYGGMILLFISLTQTMITKVIVIYESIIAVKNIINKRKTKNDDILLLNSSLHSDNILAKLNAYTLTMYVLPMILLWVIQVSPFPSTSTIYPKGITVSILFSIAIITFPIVEFLARKYNRYIRIIFITILFGLTFSPFVIDNGSWLIGNESNFLLTESGIESTISLFLSLGSDMTSIMITLIVLYISMVGYIFVTIQGDVIIKFKNKAMVANIFMIIRILFFPAFVYVFLNLINLTSMFKIMAPSLVVALLVFAYLLVLAGTSLSHYSIMKTNEIQWIKYTHKVFKSKCVSFIIIMLISFVVLLPQNIKLLTNDYIYLDTKYAVQPFEDAIYDSRVNPLLIDNNFVIAQNNDEYSKLAVIDLDNQLVISEKENDTLVKSIFRANQYIFVLFDDSVKIYDMNLNEKNYQQQDDLYIVDGVGIILNKSHDGISVINKADLSLYSSGVVDIFDDTVLRYSQNGFEFENEENLTVFPHKSVKYYSLNKEYGMILTLSEEVGLLIIDKKSSKLTPLPLQNISEEQLFGGSFEEFYYIFDNNQLSFYYELVDKDEYLAVYPLDTLEKELIRGTLPIVNNKDYQKYLKYNDEIVILYDKLSATIYEQKNNKVIDTLYIDVGKEVKEDYKKSAYGSIGDYLSHTKAVFTRRFIYNDSLYWVDTSGEVHFYSLKEEK